MTESNELLAALRVSEPTENDDSQMPHVEAMLTAVRAAFQDGSVDEAVKEIEVELERLAEKRSRLETALLEIKGRPKLLRFLRIIGVLYVGIDLHLGRLKKAVLAADAARTEEEVNEVVGLFEGLKICRKELQAVQRPREESNMVLMPDRYVKLYNATERVVSGDVEVRAWLKLVTDIEHDLTSRLERLQNQAALVGRQDDPVSHDLVDHTLQGYTESLQALALMREWCDTQDVTCLNRGWNSLVEATVAIQKYMHALSATTSQGAALGDSVILEDE